MYTNNLDSDIQFLPGVGPKRAALLKKELEISTIGELIRFYPFRYIDRSTIVPIKDIRSDSAFVQFQGSVVSISAPAPAPGGKLKKFSAFVSDGTGQIELVFFKGIKYTMERLQVGSTWLFFGKPSFFSGRINMVHPEIDPPVVHDPSQKGGA